MESIIEGYREFQGIIRGYTPKVVVATRRELLKLAVYLYSLSLTFETVTLVHLENYCIERTESKSLGYRNLIISFIRSFFTYLLQQEYRSDNPSIWIIGICSKCRGTSRPKAPCTVQNSDYGQY